MLKLSDGYMRVCSIFLCVFSTLRSWKEKRSYSTVPTTTSWDLFPEPRSWGSTPVIQVVHLFHFKISKPPAVLCTPTRLLPSLPPKPPPYQILSEPMTLQESQAQGSRPGIRTDTWVSAQPCHYLCWPVQLTSLSRSNENSAEQQRVSAVTVATSKRKKRKRKKKCPSLCEPVQGITLGQ